VLSAPHQSACSARPSTQLNTPQHAPARVLNTAQHACSARFVLSTVSTRAQHAKIVLSRVLSSFLLCCDRLPDPIKFF
jgi:hypothetical protein